MPHLANKPAQFFEMRMKQSDYRSHLNSVTKESQSNSSISEMKTKRRGFHTSMG